MWRQHLFSKLIRNPDADLGGAVVDDYTVLTRRAESDDQRHVRRVMKRASRGRLRSALFIQDCGDRLQIGVEGIVPEFLGEHCAYAFERPIRNGEERIGRPIRFVHSYFSSKRKTTKIPGLGEFLAAQRVALEHLLRQANAEGVAKPEEVKFSQGPKAGTDWERLARQFLSGDRSIQLAVFDLDGKLHEVVKRREKKQKPKTRDALGRTREAPIRQRASRAAEAEIGGGRKTESRALVPAYPQYPDSEPDDRNIIDRIVDFFSYSLGLAQRPPNDLELIQHWVAGVEKRFPENGDWTFASVRRFLEYNEVPRRHVEGIMTFLQVRQLAREGHNPREAARILKVPPAYVTDVQRTYGGGRR